MNFESELKDYILQNKLLNKYDKIVVGVSGGPDSICLIHALNNLKYELGINLTIAHFNHNLRKSALSDQLFVKEAAKSLGINFITDSARNQLRQVKGSLEEACRISRYIFFIKCCKKLKIKKICLAHSQDDLAETVLMRIIRGSGTKGLVGMLPKSKYEGHTIVRPFLSTERNEIMNYLKFNKILYRIDPTNKQKKHLRNKVRLDLIPELRKYNENISGQLSNLSSTASIDYDYLMEESNKIFARIARYDSRRKKLYFPLKEFNNQHAAMKRLLLRNAITKLNGNTNGQSFEHIISIEKLAMDMPDGSIVSLKNRIKFTKKGRNLVAFK